MREFYWLPANDNLAIPCKKGESIVLNSGSNGVFLTDYTKKGWRNIAWLIERRPEEEVYLKYNHKKYF